jgi:RNA polymerase sigma-70 factor (ECF subfamily)
MEPAADLTEGAYAPRAGGAAALLPGDRSSEHASAGAASDESDMLSYAAGNVRAFEALYDRHERAVYRFLLRSLGRRELAEDLLQEVWLTVIRNAPRYEPRARFTTWLYGIARTRLIDHWRARDPGVVVSLDHPDADGCEAPLVDRIAADESTQPEIRALDRAQARWFVAAVEALPPAQREAFLLHAEAGLSLAQVAELCAVGVETVKSRLRYARDKLRERMQAWDPEVS